MYCTAVLLEEVEHPPVLPILEVALGKRVEVLGRAASEVACTDVGKSTIGHLNNIFN